MIRLSLQPAPASEQSASTIFSPFSSRCAGFAFPYQRFKPFAFLAAQPNNILLYRNLLGSHDCLRRRVATESNHKIIINFKLIEAGD